MRTKLAQKALSRASGGAGEVAKVPEPQGTRTVSRSFQGRLVIEKGSWCEDGSFRFSVAIEEIKSEDPLTVDIMLTTPGWRLSLDERLSPPAKKVGARWYETAGTSEVRRLTIAKAARELADRTPREAK